jgi:hypothetical protein
MARKRGGSAVKSEYDIHPGVAMVQNWIATLREKTGRSLDEWLELVKTEGPPTTKERREWLKQKFQLGTNTAWWIADRADGKDTWDDDPEAYLRAAVGYVDAMFAGSKAGLRPIFEELLKLGRSMGPDVRVCPCQTIVPLYRQHVFAQIKPTTRARVDFGFALGDTGATGRLIDTGGFAKKDRITHRIPITTLADIDEEVERWLRVAYDRDA